MRAGLTVRCTRAAGALLFAGLSLMFAAAQARAETERVICVAGATTVCSDHVIGYATWTVPAGVSSVTLNVYGAAGGSSLRSHGGAGGPGGESTASFAVTPGQVFDFRVGEAGGSGPVKFEDEHHGIHINGGRAGYQAGADWDGGGGAASFVASAIGIDPEPSIVVAAGGGGGGGASGNGGDGGGVTGAGAAGAALAGAGGKYGGGGASEHFPGEGGAMPPSKGLAGDPGAHGPVYFEATIAPSEFGPGEHFQPEFFALGGSGGEAGGGGGGAGYFGGGGGGGCTTATDEPETACGTGGGGGGGGSAYVYPSATKAAGVNGGNAESNGHVEISYTTPVVTPPPPPAPLIAPPAFAVVATSQIGDQLLQLLAPSACTAPGSLLSLTVKSVAASEPHLGKSPTSYRVSEVAFYIDGGLPERLLVGKAPHRHRKTVDEPQFQAKGLPSTFKFLPSKIGAHTGANTALVEVVLVTHEGKGKHRRTVRVVKTLRSTFDVC